mgnify:CR=1 FL=1
MTFRQRIMALANHSVVVNTYHLTIMRVITFAAPLLALWHLLDVLTLTEYGVVAFGMSLIQLAALLTDAGLTLAAIQKASVFRDKRRVLGRLVGGVTGVKLMTATAYSLAILAYALFTSKHADYRPLLFLLPLSVVLIALQPSWLFLGIERARVFSRITIIGKLVYLVALFGLVQGPADYMLVIVADAAGNLVIVALSYLYMGKLGIPLLLPTKRHVSYAFRIGLGFFAARLASASYQNTTVIVLGFFTPPAVVAVYSVAEQFYKALSQMFAPLALALYPYLTRKKNMTLLLRVMGGVLIILVLVGAVEPFLAPSVLKLLNASNPKEIQSVLIILMIALVFQVTSMLAGYPLFTLLGRIDLANKTIMFGAVIYLMLVSGLIIVGRIAPHTIAWTLVATEFSVLAARLAQWVRLHRQSRGQHAP